MAYFRLAPPDEQQHRRRRKRQFVANPPDGEVRQVKASHSAFLVARQDGPPSTYRGRFLRYNANSLDSSAGEAARGIPGFNLNLRHIRIGSLFEGDEINHAPSMHIWVFIYNMPVNAVDSVPAARLPHRQSLAVSAGQPRHPYRVGGVTAGYSPAAVCASDSASQQH